MICAACKEEFTGPPLLLPSLSRKPFRFCAKAMCAKTATRRARTSWTAAVRARQARRKQ